MKYKALFLLFGLLVLSACTSNEENNNNNNMVKNNNDKNTQTATFAGGCFWCSESDFEKIDGVLEVVSGFTGGDLENPSYNEVSSGKTKHVEAVQVKYNSSKVRYEELLDVYWRHVNPTDEGGQFGDRGFQYTTAIFYHSEEQKEIAQTSKNELDESGKFEKPIVTRIEPYKAFYKAEDYHQDYYKKNPIRYNFYRSGSGRNKYIEETWGDELEKLQKINRSGVDLTNVEFTKPSDEELREILTPIQYHVTQEEGTERPFENEYHDNKEDGIYVDIVSGEPLFSSTHKYDSGTGWPSFTQPINETYVETRKDYKLILPRTEVHSAKAKSHLGHIFKDGPKDAGGLRYCLNSASLKFIPKDKMKEEGYEKYLYLFE